MNSDDKVRLIIESRGDSEHVSLDDFVSQLEALKATLERTDSALNGGQQSVEWEVTALSHSSPAMIEVRARPRRRPTLAKSSPADVIRTVTDNLEALSNQRAPDPRFDYSTVSAYRALAAPAGSGRVTVMFDSGERELEILPEIEWTAAKVLEEDVSADGTYKGQLEFLNIHGRKFEFRIYPPAGPNYVTCEFAQDKLEEAKRAVGRTVRIHGRLDYKARSPFPHRISVSEIQVLPRDSELPSLMSLRGIAPNATGELSSEEFVRSIRDAS